MLHFSVKQTATAAHTKYAPCHVAYRGIETPSEQWQEEIEELLRLRSTSGLFPEIEVDLNSWQINTTKGIFSAGLVGLLLNDLPSIPVVLRARSEIAEALLEVRNPDGTWSFAGPNGMYPPDVDDTALALAATHCVHNSTDGAICLLKRLNFSTVGLARTWIGRTTQPENVVDIVVNLHLVASLRRIGVQAQGLNAAVMWNMRLTSSPYYCSEVARQIATCAAFPKICLNSNFMRNTELTLEMFQQLSPSSISEASDTVKASSLFRRRTTDVFYFSLALVKAYRLWIQFVSKLPKEA